MALMPGCEVCGAGGQFKSRGECCERCRHALPYYQKLADEKAACKRRIAGLEHAAQMLVHVAAPLLGERERRALDTVRAELSGHVGFEDFWAIEVYTSAIICEAADVINRIGEPKFPTALASLRKKLIDYFKLHRWDNEIPTPGRKSDRNVWDDRDPEIEAALKKGSVGSLSYDEIVQACVNVGVDLSCGSCAAVFYTGIGVGEHTCKKLNDIRKKSSVESRFTGFSEWSRRHSEAFRSDLSGLRQPEDDTHTWTIETVNGGPIGEEDFWICSVCGASGSPICAEDPRVPEPFLAGEGVRLSRNCEKARMEIEAVKRGEKP